MKKLIPILALLSCSGVFAQELEVKFNPPVVPRIEVHSRVLHQEVDHDVFLAALSQIETGGKAHLVGRHGERSEYQITRAVWRLYTRRDFRSASTDRVLARDVALRHIYALARILENRGLEVTPYRLAVMWNGGPGAIGPHAPPRSVRKYGARVHNLYVEYTGR